MSDQHITEKGWTPIWQDANRTLTVYHSESHPKSVRLAIDHTSGQISIFRMVVRGSERTVKGGKIYEINLLPTPQEALDIIRAFEMPAI